MRALIFDYGAGNLHSLGKALEHAGCEPGVEDEPAKLLAGDAIVLPGVGAFGSAARRLAPALPELRRALEDGFPCLGVCLGMQLLFESSEEGDGEGLGVLPGTVRRLEGPRVPHMGWNTVDLDDPEDPLFAGFDPPVAYFANSFAADPSCERDVIARADYPGRPLVAAVRRRRTLGLQFHPEKSGSAGLALIRSFVAAVGGTR